jgi:hypothetical protein
MHWYRLETKSEVMFSCQPAQYRQDTPFKISKENVAVNYQTDGKKMDEHFVELKLRSWDSRDQGEYKVLCDRRYWDDKGSQLHWAVLPGTQKYVTTGPLAHVALRMHTEVRRHHGWAPARGITTDHMNGNHMDNRKSNLRSATGVQQAANRGKKRNNEGTPTASEHSGVYRKGDKWEGRVRRSKASVEEQRRNRAVFDTEEEAARFVNERRRLLDGQFARLNMISGSSSGSGSGSGSGSD